MIALRVHHRTIYRYREKVRLGPHRLLLRPRESRDLRLIASDVTVGPDATVTWAHDVFGNAVATASFAVMTDTLVIVTSDGDALLKEAHVTRAAEARKLENELSDLVNQAYGLTAEEITLVWDTAPPRMPTPRPH